MRTAAISFGMSQAYAAVGDATNFHANDMSAQQMADKFMTPAHLANIAGHAAVGCASASLNGGNCGAGAAGAAVGSFVTPITAGLGDKTGFAVTTLSGGIAAKLAGGNFNEGAMQSAMGYLYNACANVNNCTLGEKISTWFEGAWSVAEGTGNAVRFVARGVGLMGSEELARVTQEGVATEDFIKRYNQDPEFQREVNKQFTNKARELNTEEMKWRLNGRASIGYITKFGPAALIGDTTRAVENGHNIMDALIQGGVPGAQKRKP